jgi:hypothetical protein
MVLNQPELSKQALAVEVNKLLNSYKAPIAPQYVGAIVEYLTGLKGAKSMTRCHSPGCDLFLNGLIGPAIDNAHWAASTSDAAQQSCTMHIGD